MPGCVMSLPTNSGGKKYTVEQAELIRRLRNSGMTKEQVLMAFESFDLIDQCLGNIVNISSLTQKPGINSSSVAVLAENLMSRQTINPSISSSSTNLTTNLQTSLLSSLKIPHMTSPLLPPIIPVTLTPQPSTSVSQTSITALAASAVTPVTSVVAIAGNALQLQLSATSQQSSGASQQLQQTQVMQVLQQLGILGAAASNSITPAAATMSISKGLPAPSLTSSLPLNLSQAVSQSLLSSQLHQQPQQNATQLLSSPLPQQSQLALQLQQLPQQLQAQLHQTHSTHNSAVQASPSTALVNLSPVLQQLIQQQSQQSQNSVVQQLQQLLALQQLQQAKHLFDSQSPQALITSLIAAAASQQQPVASTATTALLPSQLIQLQQLAQLPLQQQLLQQQQQQLQHHQQQVIASLASSTPSTLSSVKVAPQTSTLQQEQLLQQIIKQLHNNTATTDKQQQAQTPVTSSSLNNPGNQSSSLVEEALPGSDDKQARAGTSGRRSLNFKNGIVKDDADEEGTFLKQEEILCCEEIKEFTVINNVKQHQIAALTGISQAYISRYLKGEYMGMSDKCCRTIKKWYLTYKNNPAAIEENANRQAQLAASRLADLNDSGGTSIEMDHSDSYTLPPPVTTVPSTASSSGLTYPRRERFVFRPNHLELLEKCFMEENYPSLKRREEIAKACNIATEKLTGRALSDKEKVGVQTISNWFANKRKDLKRLFKEADGMEAASPFLTRTRGRPPLTQSDPHFYSTIPGLSLFNHHPALKIGQRLEQQTLNGIDIGNGNEVMIGQSKENLLLGEAEAAALQLSVETAAVNQAIYSLTGQLPIIPLPPNKKGTPELSQQTAEFLSNLVANFKNSINGESSKVKSTASQSNGACDQEPVSDEFTTEQQDTLVPPTEVSVPERCSEVIYSCGESNLEGAMMFSNGQQDGDSIFDDIMSGEVAMNCELGSSD